MKKTLIALAAVAATGAAFAQSTVTLSGTVDVGISNPIGAAKARVDQSANGANQIVFSGSEDLGGGLKANFRLAQRFSPESGMNDGSAANRPTFQGESTVGLSGGFGAIKVGRSLTALQGPVNSTDPWGTLQQGSVAVLTTGYATDIDNNPGSTGGGLGRTDAVNYTTPSFNGFTASISLGLKDSQSSGSVVTGAKNLTSLWASYANGPVMVGAGTEQNRTGDKVTAILATYDLGVAKIGAGYGVVDTVASAADRKSYNIMVTAPFGAVTLKAGYGQSKLDGATASVKKTGIGADYAMSKRTTLYTSYGRDAAWTTDTTKTGFDFGIRHNF